MFRMTLVAIASLIAMGAAQNSDDLVARLQSPSEAERTAALVELGRVKTPDPSFLGLIADRLSDESEGVQLAVAYSLAGVVGKLGCGLDTLDKGQLFDSVLDATPKKTRTVPPLYPADAKYGRIQGAVNMECIVRTDGTKARIRAINGPEVLREPAVTSLKQWKYEPASRRGKPVPFAMIVRITFWLS